VGSDMCIRDWSRAGTVGCRRPGGLDVEAEERR
jgi:hypothetical protein